MPGLSVVDAPAVYCIRECFFQIEGVGSADSYFDELPFIDEEFIVVPSSLVEDFCADGGFESASFFGGADEAILI